MIHNKYSDILEQYLSDFTKEIYGRELVGKVSLSQKAIALTLDELEKEGILISRKQGNIKYFKLNLENTEIKDIIALAEINRKIIFLKKQRKLAHVFNYDNRIVGIFGSYARGVQKESSDIDMFVIGEKRKRDYDREGKPYDLNISIKYFSEKEFLKLIRNKNTLCKEIIASHILLFNIEKFIAVIWREYYGFD